VPVAAAAAFLVLAIGGVSVTSYNAQPDDALWGISKVLYSERAESVEAAARVEERIENAKDALASGQPVRAAQELAQAEKDLQTVRPQEGQGELAEAQDFLQAKAAETPEGTKVNPASPLATQPSRRVPESVLESRPSESEDPRTPTRQPDSSSPAGEGQPDPELATTPDENTGNPTTQPTNDPRRAAVAPEQGGPAPTSKPAAPPPGNGEGGPDKPSTGGSNPPATTEGGPDQTTSPVPPPRQDEGDGEAPDTGGPSASGEEAPATSN
jgi:hypothetical protein